MQKTINIKKCDEAIETLKQFKEKRYEAINVRLSNTNLKKINPLVKSNLFYKNDLFVSSDTLWEIMQPVGGYGSHHHHGLTPKEIVDVLNSLTTPYCIYKTENNRYAIVSLIIGESGEPLMIIIEVGASLVEDPNANINKFVTMYPRSNLNKVIAHMDSSNILYRK